MAAVTYWKIATLASLCVGCGVGFAVRPKPAMPGPLSGLRPEPALSPEPDIRHPIVIGDKAPPADAQSQAEKLFARVRETIRSSYSDQFTGTLPTFFTTPRETGMRGLCAAVAINLYTSGEPTLVSSRRFLVTGDLSQPIGPQPKYKSSAALEQTRRREADCARHEASPAWFIAPDSATAWDAATLVAHLVTAARAGAPLPYRTSCPAFASTAPHCSDIRGALAHMDPHAIAGVKLYFSHDYPRSTDNLVIDMQDKGGSYYRLEVTRQFIARDPQRSPEDVSTRVDLTSYGTPIIN